MQKNQVVAKLKEFRINITKLSKNSWMCSVEQILTLKKVSEKHKIAWKQIQFALFENVTNDKNSNYLDYKSAN